MDSFISSRVFLFFSGIVSADYYPILMEGDANMIYNTCVMDEVSGQRTVFEEDIYRDVQKWKRCASP